MADPIANDKLPYAKMDVLGTRRPSGSLHGQAMLAAIVQGWAEDAEGAGTITAEEKARVQAVGTKEEDDLLDELAAPCDDLGELVPKLAYAIRLTVLAQIDRGPNGQHALALLGTGLADLVLLREAEIARREKVEAANG